MKVNAPYLQQTPFIWGAFCLFAAGAAVWKMFQFPPASQGWIASWMALVFCLAAFLFLEAVWCWAQREISFSGSTIRIRRWLEILARRPGLALEMTPDMRAFLIVDGGRRFRITQGDERRVDMFVGIWEPARLDELATAFEKIGIRFEK